MRLLSVAKDGGPKSTVTGYWLVEIKRLFTVVLLRFDEGTREAYHNHAFNAVSWFLSGEVEEHLLNGRLRAWRRSWRPKLTPRSCFYKVYAKRRTWVLSFRGPWSDTWNEYVPATKKMQKLTHGRKIVSTDLLP